MCMFRCTCTPLCYNSDPHPLSHELIYSETFCSTLFKITSILTHIIFSSKLAVPARSTAQTWGPSSKELCWIPVPYFWNHGAYTTIGSYFARQISFHVLKPELHDTFFSQKKAQKSMLKKWLSSDQAAELKMGHSPVTPAFLCRTPQTKLT